MIAFSKCRIRRLRRCVERVDLEVLPLELGLRLGEEPLRLRGRVLRALLRRREGAAAPPPPAAAVSRLPSTTSNKIVGKLAFHSALEGGAHKKWQPLTK